MAIKYVTIKMPGKNKSKIYKGPRIQSGDWYIHDKGVVVMNEIIDLKGKDTRYTFTLHEIKEAK